MCRKIFWAFLFLFLVCVRVSAQDSLSVSREAEQLQRKIEKQLERYQQKGYAGAAVDSLGHTGEPVFFVGQQFYWGTVQINQRLLERREAPHGLFKVNDFIRFKKSLLQEYLENGYPTCSLRYDAELSGDSICFVFTLKPGAYYVYDTLTLPEDLCSNQRVLQQITKMYAGKPYRYSNAKDVATLIQNSELFTLKRFQENFSNGKTKVRLEIEDVTQSTFSGILGVQTNAEEKSIVTGNLDLNLINAFYSGEELRLSWQKYNALSQQLAASASFPYFYKTPLGVAADLNIIKEDSSSTLADLTATIRVNLYTRGYLSLKANYIQSTWNDWEEDLVENTESKLVGLGYTYSRFSQNSPQKKGFRISLGFDAGQRLRTVNAINNNYMRTDWSAAGIVYLPLQRFTWKFQHTFECIHSDSLNVSELNRLGGIASLRGVNENEIAADMFALNSLELHYRFDKYANLFLFTDYAYCSEPFAESLRNKRYAFGAGLSLHTRAGNLLLVYALGTKNKETFLLNTAKIHVGYSASF